MFQAFAEGAPISPLVPKVLAHPFCPHPALEPITAIPFSISLDFLFKIQSSKDCNHLKYSEQHP